MFHVTLWVAFFTLGSLTLAEDAPPKEVSSPATGSIPVPLELVADPLVTRLRNLLKNSESKETSQIEALDKVIQAANENLEFMTDLNNERVIYMYENDLRNLRVDALEEKVAQLLSLHKKVLGLEEDAQYIKQHTIEEILPKRRVGRALITSLQNADKERVTRIAQADQRAKVVMGRVDELETKAWDNTKELLSLYNAAATGCNVTNAQQSSGSSKVLVPNIPDRASKSTEFPPYLGTPQFYPQLITGFLALKHQPKYAKKPISFSSLYLSTNSVVDKDGVTVDSADMSSGRWRVGAVRVTGAEIYMPGPVQGVK